MNVSNARMNIPKAIKSLKSKCFISTTPILCKNRSQPPCNTVVPCQYYIIFFTGCLFYFHSPQSLSNYFSLFWPEYFSLECSLFPLFHPSLIKKGPRQLSLCPKNIYKKAPIRYILISADYFFFYSII